MLRENAFRQQIVLPEQQDFYDYWRSKCQDGCIPNRDDINPADIVTYLPMVSLTEVRNGLNGPRYQCRLACTGFWDLYEEEIQGRYLDELPMLPTQKSYWGRILGQVTANRRPTAGVTKTGTPLGAHLAQFWIRLPLSSNGRDVNLILGYDHLVKMSDVPVREETPAEPMRITA